MNKSLTVLLIRLALGVLGGVALKMLFFPKNSWIVAVILGAMVVIAAYASEAWRKKK